MRNTRLSRWAQLTAARCSLGCNVSETPGRLIYRHGRSSFWRCPVRAQMPACKENSATLPAPTSKDSATCGNACSVNTLRPWWGLSQGLGKLRQVGTTRRPHPAKPRQAAAMRQVHAIEQQRRYRQPLSREWQPGSQELRPGPRLGCTPRCATKAVHKCQQPCTLRAAECFQSPPFATNFRISVPTAFKQRSVDRGNFRSLIPRSYSTDFRFLWSFGQPAPRCARAQIHPTHPDSANRDPARAGWTGCHRCGPDRDRQDRKLCIAVTAAAALWTAQRVCGAHACAGAHTGTGAAGQ